MSAQERVPQAPFERRLVAERPGGQRAVPDRQRCAQAARVEHVSDDRIDESEPGRCGAVDVDRAPARRIRRRLGLQSHTFEYQEGPLELGIEQRPDSRTRQPYAHGGQHLTVYHRRAAFHVTAAQPRFSGSSSQVGHGGMVWRRHRQLLRAHCQTIARLGAPSEVRQRLAETGVEAPDSHPLGPQGQRVAIEAGGAIECQRLGRTFRRLDDVSACQGHLTPEAEVMVQNLGSASPWSPPSRGRSRGAAPSSLRHRRPRALRLARGRGTARRRSGLARSSSEGGMPPRARRGVDRWRPPDRPPRGRSTGRGGRRRRPPAAKTSRVKRGASCAMRSHTTSAKRSERGAPPPIDFA